ncbi:MAG: TolB family protein [bacterium]
MVKKSAGFIGLVVLLSGLLFWISSGVGYSADAQKAKVTSYLISPDGNHLAYGIPGYDATAEEVTQIMVCNPDGKNSKVIQTVPGTCDDICWLGNDRLLCTYRDSIIYYVVSIDGKRLQDIKLPPTCNIIYKRISPDGKKVAYVGSYTNDTGKKLYGMFVIDLETGKVRCLTDKPVKTAPAWSPDSLQLTIGNTAGYGNNYPLVLINTISGETTDLEIKGVGAAWSPDGKHLAFSTEIVKGGSWWAGVPIDGRIGILDLGSKILIKVTPSAVNVSDTTTGKWEVQGSFAPVWSSDGNWIAYHKTAMLRPHKQTKPIYTDETWIIDRTGKNAKKVIDGYYPLAWSKDNRTIYLQQDYQIDRANLESGSIDTIASWEKPKAPRPTDKDTIEIKKPGVIVKLTWIDKSYGESFASILNEAKKAYAELYGFSLPETISMNATRDPRGRLRLWTDGDSHVFLTIKSIDQLAPSPQSGVYNIYGLCHELGHIAMYRDMQNQVGLPEGIGEGMAHYLGSAVVDTVAARLGKNIWPEPYDVSAAEGISRLNRQVDGKGFTELDATQQAAKVFYTLDRKYGRKIIGQAIKQSLSTHPSGKEFMPRFIAAVREYTKDTTAGNWIPQNLIVAEVKWEVKNRTPDDSFFSDQSTIPDKTGIVLYYDTGKKDGEQSMAGGGHAVLFKKPEGDWDLDAIQIYGSRYGMAEASKDEFTIYLCDTAFEPFQEIKQSYRLFSQGEFQWVNIPIDAVKVPERFYICVAFNPTYSKGIYMAYDKKVIQVHSYNALPYTYISDVRDKYDWMIRVHLKKSRE